MLSHSGGDTSNSLHRSKSVASVKERRKHPLAAGSIDPDVAKVHALIAAHRAFDGARERTSTSLTQSESSVNQRSRFHSRDHSGNRSPASHLQRQRSTLQTRVPKLANTLQVPGTQGARVSRSDPSGYVTEFGSQSENYGAEPSSYRRLRSSRSSLTPLRQSRRPGVSTLETPFSQARTLRSAASSITLHSPGFRLRLKRSINFLRPGREQTDRNSTAPAHLQSSKSRSEDAIVLARSQYFQELNQPSLDKKPSFSLSEKAKKAQKAFRKGFHVPNKHGYATTEHQGSEDNNASVQQDKRSLSATLADKVKRVLKGSRSSATVPPQQLEATRAHFNMNSLDISNDAGFDSYLESNLGLDTQDTFQPFSDKPQGAFNEVKQFALKPSKSSSRESLTSATKSRISSWSNSTATGSVAARPPVCDPKRLSIIKEDGGPHQPSSSAGRHISGVTIFQQPLNVPEGQVINSQRVYSALMKRIDEEQEEMERTQAALKEIHDAQDQDEIVGHYLFSAPTIRRVESKSASSLVSIKEDVQSSSGEVLPLERKRLRHSSVRGGSGTRGQNTSLSQSEYESRFYPFPEESGREAASPLGGLTNEDGHEEDNENIYGSRTASDAETGSVVVNPLCYDTNLVSNRFSYSTDSLYSRTTNGGTNAGYRSPIASTENFGTVPSYVDPRHGIVTTLQADAQQTKSSRTSSCSGMSITKSKSEIGTWKEWMEQQIASLPRRGTRQTHFRERTQIEPGDTDVGRSSRVVANSGTDITNTMKWSPTTFPKPELSVVCSSRPKTALEQRDYLAGLSRPRKAPRCSASTPSRSNSPVRDQGTLRSQTNLCRGANVAISTPSTGKRKPSGIRKLSPGSVGTMLRTHWSQLNLRPESSTPGKENQPVNVGNPEPISTPGRRRASYRTSASTGGLRKGNKEISLRSNSRTGDLDHHEESPSDRVKRLLSSRLSKPFDMDIPQRNRPFDSTFLGKRAMDTDNRLSVASNTRAPRQPKSYGNIGLSSFPNSTSSEMDSSMTTDTTALPASASVDLVRHPISGRNFSSGKRFMISKYLRGRRAHDSGDTGSSMAQSPAFI